MRKRRFTRGKKGAALVLALAALAALLAGCGGQTDTKAGASATSPAEEAGRLQVVCTIFPQYDFVREIAGDAVDVTLLITPGAESHSFEPTPRDMIRLQECDVFIYAGGEGDAWVERVIESLDMDEVRILTLLGMVDAVEEELVEGMQEEGHDHEGEEGHGHDDHDHEQRELDEHVWTSPKNAMRIVRALRDVLCELDAENAEEYRANAEDYLALLEDLDADFEALAAGARRRTLVFGDRFPFRYFADAYGFAYYAAFPGCSNESEASAATMAFLIDKVREEDIPVVFTIEFSNGKIADAICESTGAEKRLLHSVHNVTRAELEAGEGYLSLMRQNYNTLLEALN